MFIPKPLYSLLLLSIFCLPACEQEQTQLSGNQPTAQEPSTEISPVAPAAKSKIPDSKKLKAKAELKPVSGSGASATIHFTETSEGVEIEVQAKGVSPGKHALHILEAQSCKALSEETALKHYNPLGGHHGPPENPPAQRHLGDLGNMSVGEDHQGAFKRIDHLLSLSGAHSPVGHAIVLQAGADDFTSPGGNSGEPVSCGVIEEER